VAGHPHHPLFPQIQWVTIYSTAKIELSNFSFNDIFLLFLEYPRPYLTNDKTGLGQNETNHRLAGQEKRFFLLRIYSPTAFE